MTRQHFMALLLAALASFGLLIWPVQCQAQLLSHQSIPPSLQPAYNGVNKQVAAKVADASTRFRKGEISKSKYQSLLKDITEWRAKTLFKVEYKEHLKGVEIGKKALKEFDTSRSILKNMRDSGQISPKEYRKRFFSAEKNLRVKSRNIDAKYSERMHTLFNKATGAEASLGSGMYVTKNGKIVIDPVTKLPMQNENFRAQTGGGDIDNAASKKSIKKAVKLANEVGMKVKIDHGSVDFEDISVTINHTSKEFDAKKALKSIAISKRGVEARLKKVTDISQRKALRTELATLREREVATKKQLKKSKLKSFDSRSLVNKETYNHVRGKEWAESAPRETTNLTKAVVDSIETHDHMNKAAKPLGKPTKKMTNEDVQVIAKTVMKTLGASASGQKGGSLNDAELGKILQGTQWEGQPKEFRKVISDLKPTKNAKDFFHNDTKGLNDLKRVARDIGRQTQTKRLNKVSAELRSVESRIGKSEGFLEGGAAKGRKSELLKKSLREIKATVRTAKNLTRESLAGSIAHQKAAGLKPTNVTGNNPELRPNKRQIIEMEGLIKGPSRGARGLKASTRVERFKAMASKVGSGTLGALKKGVDVLGKAEMARQLYEKTKEATFASKFSGKEGSFEDYKDRAKIIGGAFYEVGKEFSMVNQFNRDRDYYNKQNKEYYEKHKVSYAMKGVYKGTADLKAGAWFMFNHSPPGMAKFLADGASSGLGNYIYNKGDDARRRSAESQYSDNALRRAQATRRLRNSVFTQGQFEMMQLQREQDAMANGGYPKDSSQARAIARFLTTVNEPKLLMDRYGSAQKLQNMITGEMNDLRLAMNARREDGGMYAPAYYEGIQNRVERLNQAMHVARRMAVGIHKEEGDSNDESKLGSKNSFKLFKSKSNAFNHELEGMRYRLKSTLYDANQQKDREAFQEKDHELAVSQTFVDGTVKAVGDFFAGLRKMFGGDDISADQNLASANNPLAGVNHLKDALFESTRDALDGVLNGDGIDLDIPTPQEVTEDRQDAVRENASRDAAFENKARDLATRDDRNYKEVVNKARLKEQAIERKRLEHQRTLRTKRQAGEKRQAELDKKYGGPTMEDMFRKLTPEEQENLAEKTRLYHEKKWKERAEKNKEKDKLIVKQYKRAMKEKKEKAKKKENIKKPASIINKQQSGDEGREGRVDAVTGKEYYCLQASEEVRDAWFKTVGPDACKEFEKDYCSDPAFKSSAMYEKYCVEECESGNLCDTLPVELRDPCDDPAYRAGRQGAFCEEVSSSPH